MAGFDPACIDVEHFLETLEVRNLTWAADDELRFSCPFPNHEGLDENPSCYMNVNTSAFFCHGCKQRGNAIGFTEQLLGITPLEAIRLLRERYSPGAINPDERDMVKEIKNIFLTHEEREGLKQPVIDESVLDRMSVDWEMVYSSIWEKEPVYGALSYMFERGFDPATLSDWGFGYDNISDRPVFPVRDENGTLIGFKGRAWHDGQFPKYFVLGDKPGRGTAKYGFDCYHTSRVVFGADRATASDEPLVICEGELNAISVRMKTGRPAVAINGSHFSDFHASIIKKIANSVILFLDSDPAGEAATWGWKDSNGNHHDGIVDSLKDFIQVSVCPAHEGDSASMNAYQIEECLKESRNWVAIQINA